MTIDLEAALADWRQLLPDSSVLPQAQAQAVLNSDTAGTGQGIAAALRITSAAQLPGVLKVASRYKIAVHPISTGRNWGYGGASPPEDGGVVLDLSGLRQILSFDARLGVVTIEPGVTQGMLSQFLEQGNHPYMVPVTGAGPNCSLVGNALERGFGITPFADHFSAVTDLEAVLPDGSVYRSALREIAGDDLASLFRWGVGPYVTGVFSQGAFGVVTRMSIALARRPEVVAACLFSLRSDALLDPTVASIQQLLATHHGVIGGVNLMNRLRVLAMTAPYPTDLIGSDGLIPDNVLADMGRRYRIHAWTGFGTLYGSKRVVAAASKDFRAALSTSASRWLLVTPQRARRIERLARWIPGAAGRQLSSTAQTLQGAMALARGEPNETALPLAYWRNPKAPTADALDPGRDGCGLIWYAPIVPIVNMAQEVVRAHRMEPLITLTSNGERVFEGTTPLLFDRSDSAATARAKACYEALFTAGLKVGCAPYRFPSDAYTLPAAQQSTSLEFSRRLKQAIDPERLISPGRYGL
jgi:4-cresol dehydrogenase (hydroxylating) flavoprotein subunit